MGNLLTPFKKILSNKNTVTIIGVLLGVVVLYLGYTWRVNQSLQPTNLPYAKRTLKAGEVITEDAVGLTEVPGDLVKSMGSSVITTVNCASEDSDSCIVGRLVSYDSKISEFSFFFKTNVMKSSDKPDSIFSNIPDGETIFWLPVDNNSTYGNSIYPGNKIDLYMTARDEDDLLIFGRLISSIKVLAVKDDEGNNVFTDRSNVGQPSVLLFSVPEEYFLLLEKAKRLDGIELVPVPRNASYSSSAAAKKVENDYLREFILAKTVSIPNENTDIVTENGEKDK